MAVECRSRLYNRVPRRKGHASNLYSLQVASLVGNRLSQSLDDLCAKPLLRLAPGSLLDAHCSASSSLVSLRISLFSAALRLAFRPLWIQQDQVDPGLCFREVVDQPGAAALASSWKCDTELPDPSSILDQIAGLRMVTEVFLDSPLSLVVKQPLAAAHVGREVDEFQVCGTFRHLSRTIVLGTILVKMALLRGR